MSTIELTPELSHSVHEHADGQLSLECFLGNMIVCMKVIGLAEVAKLHRPSAYTGHLTEIEPSMIDVLRDGRRKFPD